jgi:hypothetical protein
MDVLVVLRCEHVTCQNLPLTSHLHPNCDETTPSVSAVWAPLTTSANDVEGSGLATGDFAPPQAMPRNGTCGIPSASGSASYWR